MKNVIILAKIDEDGNLVTRTDGILIAHGPDSEGDYDIGVWELEHDLIDEEVTS